jgi:branched-chain amino acid transport system permease protein
MTLDGVLQVTLFGLVWGGLYALTASGLTLVAGVMKIMNIAHGDMMMIGAYVAFWAFSLGGISPVVSVALAGPLLFLLGLALHRLLVQPVTAASTTVPQLERGTLIGFFAVVVILQNIALLLWGADYRVVTVLQAPVPAVGLSLARIVVFVLSLLLVGLLHILLVKTRFGAAVRAVSQDRNMAAMLAIDTRRIDMLAFALGTGLAGAGGALASMIYVVTPTMGLIFTLKAFTVMVVGGVGNLAGTLIAGLLLGAAEELGALIVGDEYRDVIGYGILTVVILLISYGYISRREVA